MPLRIDVSEEAGVRYLHFGSHLVQGAMRVRRPHALELEYTRAMMLPLLLRPERWPRRALLVGLGAGSLVKFLHRHRPRASLTVVELEPRVVAAARQFFLLPHDPRRIAIEIGHGHAWLDLQQARYDLILVDGFDARGSPGSLDSTPFYRACRAHLDDGGMVATNLLQRTRGIAGSVVRLREAFDEHVLVLPPWEAGNVVAIAAGDRIETPVAELVLRAETLRDGTGLDLRRLVAGLARACSNAGAISF